MKPAVIIASERDQSRAEALRDALAGFDIEAQCFSPNDPGLPKKPACVILCWSVATIPVLEGSRAIAKAAKRHRVINVKLDATAPTLPGQTVDLSRWRGGAHTLSIASLAGRIRAVLFMIRLRKWGLPLGTASMAGMVLLSLQLSGVVDLAEAPSKMCAAGYFREMCSSWGLGGVPTSEQEADYQRALNAGCSGLRDFVSRGERNPRRSDAQAKLDGMRLRSVETWRRNPRQLEVFISGDVAPTRGAAHSLAVTMSNDRASRACSRFEQTGEWRLEAARPHIRSWLCERSEDGWRCRGSGSAVCALQRRFITQVEDCS